MRNHGRTDGKRSSGGTKKGLTEGRTKERRHNILRMLSKGKSTAEIADLLDIPLHEVESLARGKSA